MTKLKLRVWYLIVAFIHEKTNIGTIRFRASELLKDIDTKQEELNETIK